MTWCDKLAAMPIAGFFFNPHVLSHAAIMDALSPILDKQYRGDQPAFALERSASNGFSYTTEDGFQTNVEPTKIAITFMHQLKARATSAGAPVAELTSPVMPYTQLLETVVERLIAATMLLPGIANRKLVRIGIVTQAAIDEEEAPPGVKKFIDHVDRPWKEVQAYGFNITSEIGSASDWTDRCIHNLSKADSGDGLLHMSFDWQRTFKQGQTFTVESLKTFSKDAQRAALAYFEELALGDRFDGIDG